MKKFFTLIAAVAMAASVNAQVFSFESTYSKGGAPESLTVNGLVLTITDTDGKSAVDENTAYFGTADSYTKFRTRFKTGGKSSSKNTLTLTLPSDGTLKVYARTGSNDATDRNIVLSQDQTELVNKILLEADAASVDMEASDGTVEAKKVYPVISVAVKKGDVIITYPKNSVNIYGFELTSTSTGITSIESAASAKSTATYNLAGQQVSSSYKGIVIKNGKKFLNNK